LGSTVLAAGVFFSGFMGGIAEHYRGGAFTVAIAWPRH